MFHLSSLLLVLVSIGFVITRDERCNVKKTAAGKSFKKGDKQLLVLEFWRPGANKYLLSSLCVDVDTYSYIGMKQPLIGDFFVSSDGDSEHFNEDIMVKLHLYYDTEIDEPSLGQCEEDENEELEVVKEDGQNVDDGENELKICPSSKLETKYVKIAKGNNIVPYKTVLITMDKGVPTLIRWDDRLGCELCKGDDGMCMDDTCMTEVDFLEEENKYMVFSVFVAWEGDDENGDKLLSKNSVDYEYRFVSGKSLYDSAVGIFNTVKNWFEDVIGNIKDSF